MSTAEYIDVVVYDVIRSFRNSLSIFFFSFFRMVNFNVSRQSIELKKPDDDGVTSTRRVIFLFYTYVCTALLVFVHIYEYISALASLKTTIRSRLATRTQTVCLRLCTCAGVLFSKSLFCRVPTEPGGSYPL